MKTSTGFIMTWYKIAKERLSQEDFDEITKDQWIPVQSSFIEAASYYAPMEIFELRMKSGREYHFNNVPKDVYEAFMNSDSKGRYFNEVIRKRYKVQG